MKAIANEMIEKKSGKFDKYELEDAVRTLKRAEEIKQNSALMRALGPHLDAEVKTHKSVQELRRHALTKKKEEQSEIE